MTRVRPATQADLAQVRSFIANTSGERDGLTTALSNVIEQANATLLIAVENGRVVGTIAISLDTEWATRRLENDAWKQLVRGNTVAFLAYGAVHPNWRRRGIATRLLTRAEQALDPVHVITSLAWIHEGGHGGHVLDANGYHHIETIEAYWDTFVDTPLTCMHCGDHCTCDAAFYMKYVGSQ